MTIAKNGIVIDSLDLWQQYGGPKRSGHWTEGRSAMEVAKAWLAVQPPAMPSEIEAALRTNAAFGRVSRWTAEPEARLRFDELAGEPRNSDLLVRGQDEFGPFVIAVEAKADEPFGDTVSQALKAAETRKESNPRSEGTGRVADLLMTLLGATLDGDPAVLALRYQLLTAVAGALAAARDAKCSRTLLLIQEFVGSATTLKKRETNARDLSEFVKILSSGVIPQVDEGVICGPIQIRNLGPSASAPQLFIGKVHRVLE